MKYVNEVKLVGEIINDAEYSHNYDDVQFYSSTILVKKIISNNTREFKIRVYFNSDQVFKYDIKSGMFVNLDGKIINSKIKGISDISVLVNDCTIIDKSDVTDDINSDNVIFEGDVTRIFTTKENYHGFVNFVISEPSVENKKVASARVVVWNRLSKFVFDNIKVGDHVIVKGYISNSKTKIKGIDDNDDIVVSEVTGLFYKKIEEDLSESTNDTEVQSTKSE